LAAHFGLAEADWATIVLQWPSGLEVILGNVAANQHLTLVEGLGVSSVGQPPSSGPYSRLLPPQPNPSSDSATLAWEQVTTGLVFAQIIDLQGKMIFSQKINGARGRNEWVWNGRDAQGAKVPAGTCTVVLQGEGWRAAQLVLRQ
jgi:hypothetical protein